MSNVDVVIDAKLEGLAHFAEAAAAMDRVKGTVDAYREHEAAGAPVDEAMRRALGAQMEAAVAAGVATKKLGEQIADARQALVHYSEAVAGGIAIDEAQKAVIDDVAEKYRQEARAATEAAAAQSAAAPATAAATAAAAGGWPVWLLIAAAIAATVAVLSPFLILIGSAAVILSTFAVAGAGALAILGGLAFGFGAVGAALAFMGAQTMIGPGGGFGADTPAGKLAKDWAAAKQALEQAAIPVAVLVLQFVDQLLPAIVQVGKEFMAWFGDRLPAVLSTISGILKNLAPDFEAFAKFVGTTMDRVFGQTSIGTGGTIKTLASSFEDGMRLMIAASQGLITNLSNLSGWFLERLPAYGPVVQQILGGLGTIVQWVFQQLGRFADWLVAHWPAITSNFNAAVTSIREQWEKWGPILQIFWQTYGPAVGDALQNIANNAGALVPIFVLVASIALGLFGALLTIVGAAMAIVKWVEILILTFENWKNGVVTNVNDVIAALNRLPGVNFSLPGGGGTTPSWNPRLGRGTGAIASASGFEGTVFQPTLFLAGEGGAPEHVSIGSGGRPTAIHIHIEGGFFLDNGPSIDRLSMVIAQRLGYTTGR